MLRQEQLNGMSLQEASSAISRALIEERMSLKKQKAELEELREKYQNDYIIANDGDSSENAPLEQAIQNLKTITGDIVSVVKKSQSLDKIDDSVYVMATYDYDVLLMDIDAMPEDSKRVLYNVFGINGTAEIPNRILELETDELLDCICKFDDYYADRMLSIMQSEYPENDEVWKSRVKLYAAVDKKLKVGVMATEYKVLTDFEHIKAVKAVRPYNYCGVIVMYTTVRLDLDGRKFTYKIYPKGLSFIDDGVMAADARLATALFGRHVGDTVSIRNMSKGKIISYTVEEIY